MRFNTSSTLLSLNSSAAGSPVTMFCFQLIATLWLAATSPLMIAAIPSTPLSTHQITTCDYLDFVHHLSCASGVIVVQTSLYGRMDKTTCSEDESGAALADINCSQKGTLDVLKKRCDGKSVCEVNTNLFRSSDPCAGTFKYVETTYACVPTTHTVACYHSIAHLRCDDGQVIHVYGANFGRQDKTTCSFGLTASQVENVACTSPATKVAEICNGRTSCSVRVGSSVFGDPCPGTVKYLEVDYGCRYPSV